MTITPNWPNRKESHSSGETPQILSSSTVNFGLAYPDARIINSRTKSPLALRTIYTHSGPDAIRSGNGLGFIDWQYTAARRRLPSPIQAQFEKVADEANAAATTDDHSLNEFIDRVISGADGAAAAFPTGVDIVAQTTETPDLLPLREIQGLNESLKQYAA